MDVTPPTRPRLIELDVVRAIALIGVCVMNFYGFLINAGGSKTSRNFAERVFDPWQGPLATRFAATFVTVAGMGITLLTRRAAADGGRAAISADRWKLVRRGVLLFSFGYFLNWVWPGTILFFYGAFFVAGALLFTLRTRWLVAIGVAAAMAAAGLQLWAVQRSEQGHDTGWLFSGEAANTRSPRELLFDVFVRGTHPLLPWLVFVCMGMVLGRMLPFTSLRRVQLAVAGALLLQVGYLTRDLVRWHPQLESTIPTDRGVLYTLTTIGSTLMAVTLLGWLAQLTATHRITRALGVTGRSTLTLYVGHVLVFNLLVHRLEWVRPGGLGTALLFAGAYWLAAVGAAVLWHRRFSTGPLEWVYRRFSDASS